MSQKLQVVRGAHDLIGSTVKRYRYVVEKSRELAAAYGFEEIKTPIFEPTAVFSRTLGDASDIVTKEMYTFADKGGDFLSLRPEGTAGAMRAFIELGLQRQLPVKWFYEGPMFRYERPQKGRYRQFYQIGAELLGPEGGDADVELISLAQNLLEALGVSDKARLEINSIGDKESRDVYRTRLVEYYKHHETGLSEDSRRRLALNPLRILDSKNENDIKINENAPSLFDSLNESSRTQFEKIQKTLSDLGIPFAINRNLVRGLDYYSHLVFEFRTNALGAQDAILSGGRYDGLCEMMGGAHTPAVGWAAGIERLSLLMLEDPLPLKPVSLIPAGEAAERECTRLAHEFRRRGFAIDLSYSGNMSNRMKKAVARGARAAIIIGDQELANKVVTLKMLDTGTQSQVSQKDLPAKLAELFGK